MPSVAQTRKEIQRSVTPPARRVVAAVAAIATLSTLTGCLSWAQPTLPTPARWQGGESFPTTSVVLEGDGLARLVDFPKGVTRPNEDGRPCLDISGPSTFTGEATWRSLNAYAIEVQFDESVVTISSGPAVFGSQDWTELGWTECDSEVIWILGAAS